MVVDTCKRIMAIGAVVVVGAWAHAAGMPPPHAVQAAAAAEWLKTESGLGVQPLALTLRATIGEPTVVHFRVARAASFDRVAPVTSSHPDRVRVIDAGQVPAGQRLGSAIIEARTPGMTTIHVAGTDVDVVAVEPAHRSPEAGAAILTPIDGAAAWGRVHVSATWWRPAQRDDRQPSLRVLGDDGRELHAIATPAWTSTPDQGPTAIAAYELDADALPPGKVQLELAWPGTAAAGDRVSLRVVRAAESSLFQGECEATYELPPLPEDRRQEPKPSLGRHRDASGGGFFNNAGTLPRFRFPLVVGSDQGAGWYQVIARAGGDIAATTLPAIGVTVDEAQYPLTRAAIAMPGFHRTPIGVPVRLEPGSHVIRLDFLNDFYGGPGVDRNLRLDAIEVLRVADAVSPPASAPASDAAMTMAGGEMTAMAARSAMSDAASMSPMSAMSGGTGSHDAGDDWPASAAARARRATPPLIAFARSLDGAAVAGDLDVRAAAWWPGIGEAQAIKDGVAARSSVTLLINGQPTPRQYSAAPRFVVPAAALRPGENRLQLVLDTRDGSTMSSLARVRADPGETTDAGAASAFHRFAVHDPRWSPAARSLAISEQNPPERACFGLVSEGELELAIPAGLEGEYDIELEARGTSFNGPAELAVRVEREGEPSLTLGIMALGGGWEPVTVLEGTPADRNRRAATLVFTPGQPATTLKLAFINDLYEPEKGDRNAYVQAVALRPRATAAAERAVPRGNILWPRDGETMRAGAAAALVLEPAGLVTARTAEVVIDGERTGQVVDVRGRAGPLVVPVSLRGVGPGERELAVRLEGGAGQSLTLAGRHVRVLPADAPPTTYDRAVTLLNRVAFGPDERELAAVLTLGPEEYLDRRLAAGANDPDVARGHALATIRYRNSSSGGDVQRRAILEALTTENPLRYRFVLFVQNHFSTWIRKTEARRKADEHERFCLLGVAPFGDLLRASATSPAMLRYLDQEQSFARRLNENYAREIMELHTLGVNGGYTQEDVTTLARMLTGWTTAREPFVAADEPMDMGVGPDEYGMREVFRYDPGLADGETRVFLGRRFAAPSQADRHQRVLAAVGLLAGHPSTARFVSGKLVAHLVAHPAPPELVEQLASTFEQSDGDMRQVMRTLAMSEQLHQAPPRLAHPPIFAFRLARAVGSSDANAVHDFLNLSGQGMFDRSTPDGYPESDAEVTDSNAMLQRWKFARRLESALVELVPAARRYGDKPISDAESAATVDLLAMRITGRLLGEHSHAAALDLLGKTDGRRDDRWRALAVFIASTPEAQIR